MRRTTRNLALAALTSLAVASPCLALAEAPCVIGSLEELMKRFAAAFAERKLEKLDRERPWVDPIQIVVEHSIQFATENDEVSSLGAAEKWLRKREGEEGLPARASRPLKSCSKGLCVFDFFDGISHNTVYLHHVLYGCRSGRPYIKAAFFLDGD